MKPTSQVIRPGESVTLPNGTRVSVIKEISSHEKHANSIPTVFKEGDTNALPNGNTSTYKMITYKKQNSKRNIEQEFSHEIREGEMVTLPDGTTISVKKRDAYRIIQPS